MKTAKPPQMSADNGSSSNRRSQPARQARTNPPRSSSNLGRTFGGRDSISSATAHDQPIDIFPAVGHFTDTITSLPKDLARQFTLLKEVDAKIYAPEETLFHLVNTALKSNPPEPLRLLNDAASSVAPGSAPMSAQNSSSGFAMNGSLPPAPSADDGYNSALFGPQNIPRRQLFRQTAFKIQEMLGALEEKNHVISAANEALSKQLSRINDVWPHLEAEFTDEAKWGSTTHWAYPENRVGRAGQAERSRREGAATITAAAQQLAEEAAARSDARKQAVLAKKSLKANQHHHDSDMDDHEGNTRHKAEHSKKSQGGSKRKGAEPVPPVGLGISSASSSMPGGGTAISGQPVNGNPPPKRRKVENHSNATNSNHGNKQPGVVNGGVPMERALSGVFGNNGASKSKNSSPRATPVPEAAKKRKALPTANGQTKKKTTAPGLSPTVASSPVQPNFPEPKVVARASPAPTAPVPRPNSSRARQNSTHSVADNTRQRPPSSAASKPNGAPAILPDFTFPQNGSRGVSEVRPPKEQPPVVKSEPPKEPALYPGNGGAPSIPPPSKKEPTPRGEGPELKTENIQAAASPVTTVVTTKSGRASKPSTPALGNFPEPMVRSRASRSSQGTNAKRSHKKGAAQQALAAQTADDDATSSAQGDDEGEIDADEPRYCYCNGVSYGEMIACDADGCEREWFHLDCVGLKDVPSANTKWYCDNCKDRMKTKKVNGR